ncbi:MAG TPA: hypothetical protein VNC84_07745 [Gammaproteobacteria bacterium]|jgi:hypothetical protein|nr:hypothetical protein [Gammaproteobacteria bacterium]
MSLIEQYVSPFMQKHLSEHFAHLDEREFHVQLEEFLKFLYIVSIDGPGAFIPVNAEIDAIWHEYILQTREYEQLCLLLPNKVFVHHQSATLAGYTETADRESVLKRMLQWLPRYYQHFGPFTEKTAQYWTMVQFLSQEFHFSLEEINKLASSSTT